MSRFIIDVSGCLREMERLLRLYESPARCEEVIAILRCWQDDDLLDDASRERAKTLVHEFRARPRLRAAHHASRQNALVP